MNASAEPQPLAYVQATILTGLPVHALPDAPGARLRMYSGDPVVPGTALCGITSVDGWFLQGGKLVPEGNFVSYIDPAPFHDVTAVDICLDCVYLYAEMVA